MSGGEQGKGIWRIERGRKQNCDVERIVRGRKWGRRLGCLYRLWCLYQCVVVCVAKKSVLCRCS